MLATRMREAAAGVSTGCTPTDSAYSNATLSAGNNGTHEADFVMEFTATTLGSFPRLQFRRVDADNFYRITYSATTVYIQKVVEGSSSNLFNEVVNPSNGDVMVIVCNDESISAYVDGALLDTATGQSDFKTATVWYYERDNGGSQTDDLTTWPYPCGLDEVTIL